MIIGPSFRRRIAALALVSASLLAACGPVPVPMPVTPASVTAQARSTGSGTGRRYGMIFDSQTPRVRWSEADFGLGTKYRVDLRAKLSPVDDQGTMNSCTGFAVAGLAEYRAIQEKRPGELSPGFVYVWELKLENRPGQDEGARISTGMQVLKDKGIAPLERMPYLTPEEQKIPERVTSYLTVLPSLAVMQAARVFAVPQVTPVEELAAFKRALNKGKPVVFGMACYKSFESDAVRKTGIVPIPDQGTEPYVGGHAILAVGYDDSRQRVIFRNSYSAAWGDKGYGYLPYDYFKKDLVGDAWIAE